RRPDPAAPDAGPAQVPRPEPRFQHREGEARPRLRALRRLRRGHAPHGGLAQGERLESRGGRSRFAKRTATEATMELQGKRAAILVEQQYQELEVWYPLYRLREAGCKVTLVGPEAGQTYPSKLGYPAKSDKAAKDVSAADFDLIVIPGGFAP